MSMPPPQGFQRASALPRIDSPGPSTTTPRASASSTNSSHRNASGGLPPVPKFSAEPTTSPAASTTTTPPALSNKPVNRPTTSKNAILYSHVQRKNPVLKDIKGVGLEISDIQADFQVGTHNGVLFLSLKYHRLHPEYIHGRIDKMKNMYNVRIILVLCDINEHQQSIREISKTAIINDFTVFVAWSNEEVAQYLTTLKQFEHKSANTLKEKVHQTYPNQLHHVLTSGKKVSKTDANNLSSEFGSFYSIVNQPLRVLSNVKGLGTVKVTSLSDAFNKPFLVGGLNRSGGERAKGKQQEVEGESENPEPSVNLAPVTALEGSPEWEDTVHSNHSGSASPPGEEGEEDEPAAKRSRVEV